ncbi:MAG TPA: AI-2E family transporter, partial [Candidatus Woesebacteria bacterium]|nr:AI-2E family transporter [Candidatus Woesebacteria bacterium]
ITPKVMKDQVSLPPLLTIFVLLAGAKLGGLGGAILSIPIYLTFEVIYKVFVRGTVKPNSV